MSPRAWRYALAFAVVFWSLVALAIWGVRAAFGSDFRSPWPSVRCADTPGLIAAHAGGVYHDGPGPDHGTIDLRVYVCHDLGAMQDGLRVTEARYLAVFLLAHELSHASGIPDERQADCHAQHILVSVARRIGVPSRTLRALAAMNVGFAWRCDRDHSPGGDPLAR
jgi:hypothetical protein